MSWRLAKSLGKLRDQVNKAYPNRDKASDGGIGDARHKSSVSDHNPWVRDGNMGVVTAFDIDRDLTPTTKVGGIVDAIIASRDKRVKYIIWNSRIISSYAANGYAPWTWRPYSGKNKHTEHVHVSVKSDKASYDNEYPWAIAADAGATVPPQPVPEPFNETHYIVQSGDTLSKIASSFKMTWKQLQMLNGMKSDRIFPGDKLRVSLL